MKKIRSGVQVRGGAHCVGDREPIDQVAQDLDVHAVTLGNWVNTERLDRADNGQLDEDSLAELIRLRKEVAEVADGGVMCSSDPWSCG